ncbi:MAG: PAS domain-containing protein, partial [Hyphomicrobiales bacterium]
MTDRRPDPGGPTTVDFRALFHAVPQACVIVAPDAPRYTVLAANTAFLDAVGVRGGDLDGILGRALFEVLADRPGESDRNRAADL